MKLKPKNVNAEFINYSDDYTVIRLLGSPTLVYGTSRKKTCKGIAFKDTNVMREVAKNMIFVADLIDKTKVEVTTDA